MGFRFQRRIGIARGVQLNLSKSGVGGSAGRAGLRLGVDVRRRKYFSVGLPGTGLSYRTFFGKPLTPQALKKIVWTVVGALCLGSLIMVAIALKR
jgi:hypothetical protein